jgi:hypothetical protein
VKWPWLAQVFFSGDDIIRLLGKFSFVIAEICGCDRGRSLQMFQVKKPTVKPVTLFALQPFASIEFERNLNE